MSSNFNGENTKMVKNTKPILVLLTFLLITQSFLILGVTAQGQATVTVLDSVGGSTDPGPGTYNYNNGQQVILTATPDQNLVFVTWLISSDTSNNSVTDNPYTLAVTGGTTYTISAVFAQLEPNVPAFPNQPSPAPETYGSVSILSAVGGRTEPAAGTYYFTSVYRLNMRAIPNNGWQFSHWIITGDTNTTHGGYPFTTTPTDNPYTFDCGIGYTYAYQPVFAVSNQTGTPGGGTSTSTFGLTTELIVIIALIVVIVILLIGFGVVLSRRRRP